VRWIDKVLELALAGEPTPLEDTSELDAAAGKKASVDIAPAAGTDATTH
jgi:hypothetical protein